MNEDNVPVAVPSKELLAYTAQIVSAHVANNAVNLVDLPGLIQDIYRALAGIDAPSVAPKMDRPLPAVPIKKSLMPDYIVCLEDGRKLKMLKRHLKTTYNLTPDQYRERWGLPSDYPMVAPNYAEKRSSLAKQIGLGRKPNVPVKPVRRAKPAN
jgi:predicted transcriptional regulator